MQFRIGGMRLFQTESSDWSEKVTPRSSQASIVRGCFRGDYYIQDFLLHSAIPLQIPVFCLDLLLSAVHMLFRAWNCTKKRKQEESLQCSNLFGKQLPAPLPLAP
ncbi:hypothetical protein F6476_08210 [Pseudomonas umsongensis]|nr:hypothetical protein F6476_08210 [Pseudomonas umsongensis]